MSTGTTRLRDDVTPASLRHGECYRRREGRGKGDGGYITGAVARGEGGPRDAGARERWF